MKKLRVTVDGQAYEVEVEALEEGERVATPAGASKVASSEASSESGEAVKSPLAGKVVELKVAVGDSVGQGDTLLVLEAMKMNTLVSASTSGTVREIHASPGDMVEEGQSLLTIG